MPYQPVDAIGIFAANDWINTANNENLSMQKRMWLPGTCGVVILIVDNVWLRLDRLTSVQNYRVLNNSLSSHYSCFPPFMLMFRSPHTHVQLTCDGMVGVSLYCFISCCVVWLMTEGAFIVSFPLIMKYFYEFHPIPLRFQINLGHLFNAREGDWHEFVSIFCGESKLTSSMILNIWMFLLKC